MVFFFIILMVNDSFALVRRAAAQVSDVAMSILVKVYEKILVGFVHTSNSPKTRWKSDVTHEMSSDCVQITVLHWGSQIVLSMPGRIYCTSGLNITLLSLQVFYIVS